MVRIKISEFTKADNNKFGGISRSIVLALENNAHFPDLPVPSGTALQAIDVYDELVAQCIETSSPLDFNSRNTQRQIVTSYLLEYSQYVQYKIRNAANPEELAQSAGMKLAKSRGKRVSHPFGMPQNVRVKSSSLPGCLDLRWKPVVNCRNYVIERCVSKDAQGALAIWERVATSTKANCRVSHLPSAQYAILRVRAVNSFGYSDPSEQVRCIVG